MPALLAPGNAASHAFVNLPIDATQLQQLKELCDAIQPAGQHIDGHLAVRDMQIGRGGKNDSAVDLPNWPMEQHAYAPASYPNIATETNHTPGPYFLLPPHRHTCEPEPIVRGSDTTPEVPSDDMSDDVRGPESEESDFAPEGSGDEDELDFADSDYTEPGRSRRSGGGPKRKSDGAIKQPKDSKRPKMCKKPLFRTKESALLTVANEEFEQDGVPCVKFGYTNKGKQTAHIMRVDVEDIDEESFTTSFKETYCIYPKAICSRDEYKGSRWAYEVGRPDRPIEQY